MKLSEMRELLDHRGIQLTKSLGQNFLHDVHQLERIVSFAELTPTDKVLEIGPGLGPLTELLLAKANDVLAIEKDARLVEVLNERFKAQIIPHSALRTLHLVSDPIFQNDLSDPSYSSDSSYQSETSDRNARRVCWSPSPTMPYCPRHPTFATKSTEEKI